MGKMNLVKNKSIKNKDLYIVYSIIFSTILLPTINFNKIPGFRIEQIIIMILFIYSALRTLLGMKIRINNLVFISMYVSFSFFILLSIFVGSLKGIRVLPNDFFETYKIFIYLSVYVVTTVIVVEDEDREKVLKFIIFCFIISTIIAVQQYFNLFGLNDKYIPLIAPTQYKSLVYGYSSRRVIGMTSNPNVYSVMPAIGGLISWSLFLSTNKKRYLLLLFTFSLTVLMTSSRTGLVFLVVCLFVFSIQHLSSSINKKNLFIALRIVFSISALFFLSYIIFVNLPEELTWRIKLGFNIGIDTSFQARLSNWNEHLEYFNSSPIFGIGPAKSINYIRSVDNEWLLFLRQYGIIGSIYIALVFFVPFIMQKKSFYKKLYLSVLAGAAVYMIPAAIYHSFQLMPLVMIIAGLIPTKRKRI